MTVRDKKHEYYQKLTFWNLICRYAFAKRDEKVTRKTDFLCFPYFFKKIRAPFIDKTCFAKYTKSSRCLHFGCFKAIESSIYSVLMAILYWDFIIWTKLYFYPDRYAYCIFIYIFHKNHENPRFFFNLNTFFLKFRQFPQNSAPIRLLKIFWHPSVKAFGKISINFRISLDSISRARNQLDHKKSYENR